MAGTLASFGKSNRKLSGRTPTTSPVEAPKRTLDVAALANWLALRAADEKTKRVDVLEQAAAAMLDELLRVDGALRTLRAGTARPVG